MRLKSRGIEPDSPEGFTLAQIVRAMTDDPGNAKERSLQAHAELQQHQAALARLKLANENGELVGRREALMFMGGLVRTFYDGVYHLEWPATQEAVEEMIQDQGIEYYARHGWALEPETVFVHNGERPPPSRRERWASAVCS
jgi:hypothetical protein